MPAVAEPKSLAQPASRPRGVPAALVARCWRPDWTLAVLLLCALVWLYRTPYNASTLEVVPDSVEYAVSAAHLYQTGRYDVVLEGRSLPPRYPPWFPATVIVPAYALLGADPGNAIFGITAFAVSGVGFAWAIGRRISAAAGGLLAGFAVLFLPVYAGWSTQVMTDVPAACLMLATCLLYLQVRAAPDRRHLGRFFAAGLLIAVAALFRPVYAAMLLPLAAAALRPWRLMAARGAVLVAPVCTAAAATLAYNRATFGSAFRNGYKFWSPVPYDFPALVFSVHNIPENAARLWQTGLPVLLLAVCAVGSFVALRLQRRAALAARTPLEHLAAFVLLTCGPITLFHLLYFFPAQRFFLPLVCGAAVSAGAVVGRAFGENATRILKLIAPGVLMLVTAYRIAVPEPAPLRRIVADEIAQHTPSDAIVISTIDSLYLEHLTGRRIVPLSRDVEYAGQVLAPKPFDNRAAAPKNSAEAIAAGGIKPVRFVAIEQIGALEEEVAAGKRLFFDASSLDPTDGSSFQALQRRFRLELRAPGLYEMLRR